MTGETRLKLAHFGPKCPYCCGVIVGDDGIAIEGCAVDHVVPLSRGGPDLDFNKALCHAYCNALKSSCLPSEFLSFPSLRAERLEKRAILRMKKMGLEIVDYVESPRIEKKRDRRLRQQQQQMEYDRERNEWWERIKKLAKVA